MLYVLHVYRMTYSVHKDTARYVLRYSKPLGLRPKDIAPRKENFSEVDLIEPRLQVLYFFFI